MLVAQIFGRDAPDVSGGDARDRVQLLLRRVRIAVDDRRAGEHEGLALGGLALADCGGQDLVLRFGQFGGGDGLGPEPRDLTLQRRLALIHALAARDDRIGDEVARRLLGVEERRRRLRQLVAIDEALVQPRALTRRQDRLKHRQRGRVRVAVGGHVIADKHGGKRRVGFVYRPRHRPGAGRLGDGNARDRSVRLGDRSEIPVDPAVELDGIEVSRHDQDRVVGPVVGRVECAHVVDRSGLEVVQAADSRPRVGMYAVGQLRIIDGVELAVWAGECALTQLLLDHVALGRERHGLDHQARHAVRLREQQPLEVVRGYYLEIVGVIVARGGVVVAADILRQPIDLFGDEVARRLEHQMLEHVREAGLALGIVLGPDIVPDLHRHVRCRRVANGEHAQAVRQRALGIGDRLHRRRGRRRLGERGARQGGRPEQQGDADRAHLSPLDRLA